MYRHAPGPSLPRRSPRHAAAVLLAGLAAAALAGCGSDPQPGADAAAPSSSGAPSSSAPTTSSSAAPATAGTTIRVRVDGDSVSPSNDRIQVAAGQPVTLRVVSDREGELHVHSSPETTFDFGPGTSTKRFTIARPGIVELEEHVSDTLVAQLEVR